MCFRASVAAAAAVLVAASLSLRADGAPVASASKQPPSRPAQGPVLGPERGLDSEGLFEGDIELRHTNHGMDIINEAYGAGVAAEVAKDLHIDLSAGRGRRGATSKLDLLWPGGVLVYTIRDRTDARTVKTWNDAVHHWEEKTNLRFRKKAAGDADFVEVHRPSTSSCTSAIGRDGGRQFIRIGSRCSTGNVIHEIGHAFGFHHEQSRPDRDDYVEIHDENIESLAKARNFRKMQTSQVDSMRSPYDFGSIMHYKSTAFSKNKKATITARPGKGPIRYQRDGLSASDIQQANRLYNTACAASITADHTQRREEHEVAVRDGGASIALATRLELQSRLELEAAQKASCQCSWWDWSCTRSVHACRFRNMDALRRAKAALAAQSGLLAATRQRVAADVAARLGSLVTALLGMEAAAEANGCRTCAVGEFRDLATRTCIKPGGTKAATTAAKVTTEEALTTTPASTPTTAPALSGGNYAKAKNLQAYVGECDSDAQCASGLKCFQRSNGEAVPGCTGAGKYKHWDYCYDPALPVALSGGNNDGAKNLQACRGECDSDAQCASGLKCFQRSNGEAIPGCTGAGKFKNWDYCYDPAAAQ